MTTSPRPCKFARTTDPTEWDGRSSYSVAEALAGQVNASAVQRHRNGSCSCPPVLDPQAHLTVSAPNVDSGQLTSEDHLDSTVRMSLDPEGVEFSGVPSEGKLTNWDHIFEKFDLDPAEFEIVDDTVRASAYQQSRRTDDGDRDVVTLYSYRARFTKRRTAVNLPALYAEVAKTTPTRAAWRGTGEDNTVVVAWADIQTGKVDSLGGTRELLARLDEKRARLRTYLDHRPTERIVVADVGDIVEGFSNVSSQINTNDLSLMDQVDIAATEMWKTIRLCAEYAPVDVLSIPSNHAQWRQGKGLAGKPNDDWGIHISKRLEHLAAEVGLDATFHRPADEWSEALVHDVHGTPLGLVHGHQANNPDKVTAWWSKMSHAGVVDCDVLLSGHFHFLKVEPSGRSPRTGRARWHLQAPTLDNGSAWVNNTMGEDGDPGLLVFGINTEGFDLSSLSVL